MVIWKFQTNGSQLKHKGKQFHTILHPDTIPYPHNIQFFLSAIKNLLPAGATIQQDLIIIKFRQLKGGNAGFQTDIQQVRYIGDKILHHSPPKHSSELQKSSILLANT